MVSPKYSKPGQCVKHASRFEPNNLAAYRE